MSTVEDLEHIANEKGVRVATQMSLRPPAPVGVFAGSETSAWLRNSDHPPAALEPPALQVGEEIGKGGMGVVYRAVQTDLGREVAVKEIVHTNAAAVAHFIGEARITGLIEHANVVPIHLLAVSRAGAPQIAMKLVKGESLRDLILGHPPPPLEDLLRVLLSACNAVAYAHQRGIIHRDLKPDNIMVGEFGQVFVLDWGIAAGLDEAMCRRHGILHVHDGKGPMGTPAYLAPELARGRGYAHGRHTDVYLLGSCLHEILTGEPRHAGDTVAEVLAEALDSEPHEYQPAVPWELAEIANRATAADPEERYPSVEAFAGAIEAYLEHLSAHALAAEGLAVLARLRELTDGYAAADEAGRRERTRAIAGCHAEAQFAFRHALGIWQGTREAERGAEALASVMLAHAVATEDLPLAERVVGEVHDDGAAAATVAELRQRLDDRGRELEQLRDRARRMDWARIGGPLGRAFVLGGALGACTLLVTKQVIARQVPHAFLVNGGLWLGVALAIGAFAMVTLRGAQLPGSLASPRVLHTWGAVGIGVLCVGLFNELRPVKLSYDMCYPPLLVGVGFVAMAMQTRRWLLLAALPCYLGAALIALFPDFGYEVLAVVSLTAMSGVGVALMRGATLDEAS